MLFKQLQKVSRELQEQSLLGLKGFIRTATGTVHVVKGAVHLLYWQYVIERADYGGRSTVAVPVFT